jgi:hypothetical protein
MKSALSAAFGRCLHSGEEIQQNFENPTMPNKFPDLNSTEFQGYFAAESVQT